MREINAIRGRPDKTAAPVPSRYETFAARQGRLVAAYTVVFLARS